MHNQTVITGRQVIPALADIFRQLYLVPGEESQQLYKGVVLRGEEPPTNSLAHFITSDRDRCSFEQTPAGEVRVIVLDERQDFETFLRIMANRCAAVEIPRTQGASIISGIINRRRIDAHREEFEREHPDAGLIGWNAEFRRFTQDKSNYTESLIVLSTSPYSGIPASDFGFTPEEWLGHSMTIRMYHECTHFVCRKLFPEQVSAVWDEAVADTVGIYAAFGRTDAAMAEHCFGITDGRYTGGRLENYLDAPTPEQLDRLADGMHRLLKEFDAIAEAGGGLPPFELAMQLEQKQDALKGLLEV
ncbi:MAG: hypothetical protein IKN55_11185 [Oscillospiraceae bacterium]|nr:hypothetical protein [Oscillospiraceae bacterium]